MKKKGIANSGNKISAELYKKLLVLREKNFKKMVKPFMAIKKEYTKKATLLISLAEQKKVNLLKKKAEAKKNVILLIRQNPSESDASILSLHKKQIKHSHNRCYKKFKRVVELKKKFKKSLSDVYSLSQANSPYNDGKISVSLPELSVSFPSLVFAVFQAPYAGTEKYSAVGGYPVSYDNSFANLFTGAISSDYTFTSVLHDVFENINEWSNQYVGIGMNVVMPKDGNIRVTAVLQNLDSLINGSLIDHFGFSDGSINANASIYISIMTSNVVKQSEAIMTSFSIGSDGDDVSSFQNNLQTDIPFVLTFLSEDTFTKGEFINIIIGSKISSVLNVNDMEAQLSVNVGWVLQKVYFEAT